MAIELSAVINKDIVKVSLRDFASFEVKLHSQRKYRRNYDNDEFSLKLNTWNSFDFCKYTNVYCYFDGAVLKYYFKNIKVETKFKPAFAKFNDLHFKFIFVLY